MGSTCGFALSIPEKFVKKLIIFKVLTTRKLSICLINYYTRRVREILLATIDIYIEKYTEGLCAEKVPLMRVYSRAEGGLFRHTDL